MDLDFTHLSSLADILPLSPLATALRNLTIGGTVFLPLDLPDRQSLLDTLEIELAHEPHPVKSFLEIEYEIRRSAAKSPDVLEILITHGVNSPLHYGYRIGTDLGYNSFLLFVLYGERGSDGEIKGFSSWLPLVRPPFYDLEERMDAAKRILLYIESVRNLIYSIAFDEGEVAEEVIGMMFAENDVMDYYNTVKACIECAGSGRGKSNSLIVSNVPLSATGKYKTDWRKSITSEFEK